MLTGRHQHSIRAGAWGAVFVCLLTLCGALPARSQSLSDFNRERGRLMLKAIKVDLKKNYYDPGFRGIDVDVRFQAADEKIKQATSIGQMFGIIAQALLDFNDSHTFFIPPSRAARTDYEWQMQMIGDKCFVIAVKPGSDAEAKGLKVGDEVLQIDNLYPLREDLWKLKYLYYTLRPKPGMRVVVRSPNGQQRQLDVMAKVTQGKLMRSFSNGSDLGEMEREAQNEARLSRHRYHEIGNDLVIWKMPQFDQTDGQVDGVIDKARKHKSLILDLRGNGGGAETTLLRLIGNLIDHDVKVGDIKRRKETKPLLAKTRGERVFKGNLVVLVDSESGSAAEVFARVIQIEKRGTVIGDRTAGAVMRSRSYVYESGVDIVAFYAVSITDADLTMTDGSSLEHRGVTPDELLLPAAADLAAGRDPILSRAAAVVGVELDPTQAGKLFPVEWRK